LKGVYRAVDQQIGKLIESAGTATTVMVFALHGMRPALGFPAFLGPLLCELGFAQLATWRSQTWKKRLLSLFAEAKRRTPTPLKQLYYQVTPPAATYKLARPTMLPAYDWQRTRAFSLPTDQFGWIRINLMGRESQGIVPLDEYESLCTQLEQMLLSLASEEGHLLVQDVNRTAADTAEARVNPLPDLVIHWRDAAFTPSLRIKGSNVPAQLVSKKSTGQHSSPGFCIYRGRGGSEFGSVVAAKDLAQLIITSGD
jgi:predicted AlkP superfamily phosphohydrolase/phosphomutase